jgi:pimeloyl-ACP methyl ester carboxylesterase
VSVLVVPPPPARPDAERAVLVPGNDLDAGFYEGLAGALAARGVALARLRLPGWGGVPPLEERGWRPLVSAVRAAVEAALGEGGGTLAGHSLGALTALLVAAEAPRAVRRLCLLEPVIAPLRGIAAGLARAYLREVVHGDRGRFRNGDARFRRVHDLRRFPREAIAHYLAVRASSERASAAALFEGIPALYPLPLERVRVPALLLRGARSGLLSRVAQAWLRRGLPRGRAVVLPRTGHWVANESDEAAAAAIAGFIATTPDPARLRPGAEGRRP